MWLCFLHYQIQSVRCAKVDCVWEKNNDVSESWVCIEKNMHTLSNRQTLVQASYITKLYCRIILSWDLAAKSEVWNRLCCRYIKWLVKCCPMKQVCIIFFQYILTSVKFYLMISLKVLIIITVNKKEAAVSVVMLEK